jgi:hypothetical protein
LITDLGCLALLIVFSGCNFVGQERLTGRDVRLFKDTPAWDVALAIRDNDTAEVRKLLEGKPKSLVDYRENYFGQSLLHWAVYRDNYSSAKILVESGADPSLKANDSTSAIIHAADKNETTYLKLLLKHGGDPNAIADIDKPQDLRTPLIAAAFKNLENVKLLIDAGGNPDYVHRTKRGNIGGENIQSALIYAFRGGKIDIVRYLLLDVGVDFDYVFNTTLEGKPLTILTYLRDMPFPLDSKEYKIKMEVVTYLKSKGLDYWKEPIPERYKKNYEKDYLEKY